MALGKLQIVAPIAVLSALLFGPGTMASADTPDTVGEPYTKAAAERLDSSESAPAAAPQQAEAFTYTVQAGDTLWGLARKHGVSLRALAHANGLRTDSLLPVGRHLVIPPRGGNPAPVFHLVEKGECLWHIARRYGTTAQTLADMNGLRVDGILPVGLRLKVPSTAEGQGAQGESLVQTAMAYRGVRYRYGGMTTRGMDCSGLVARVLGLHGIDAPHNSTALYKLGRRVSKAELRPGDLVFFNTRGRGISHVGIYVGDGEFIHASSGRGRVRVDTLEEGYYSRRYVGARRIE